VVAPCDVKDIQNTPMGVSGFWLKSMLANKEISRAIFEKDRAILGYLQSLTMDLHEKGYGYDLSFHFEKNSYFKETTLKKSFSMSQQNVIEKCDGTSITWTPGSDVTHTKKKKGKGKNKKTVTVKCESFFNFFATIDVQSVQTNKQHDDEDDEHDEEAEQMDADFELGNTIKDDLIPLALEYYLGVIDQGEDDSDEEDEGDDGSDSDEKPKPKKEKKVKAADAGAAGAVGPDGKQQECKQQ